MANQKSYGAGGRGEGSGGEQLTERPSDRSVDLCYKFKYKHQFDTAMNAIHMIIDVH